MIVLHIIVFVTIVSTPFLIQRGWWVFSEAEMEAMVLLCAGVVSFMMYRFKDCQLSKNSTDRVALQRKVARAQKELHKSYSYIGHANRRTDIMYEIFSNVSYMDAEMHKDSFLHAMELLPYTSEFAFRFIAISTCKAEKKFSKGDALGQLPDTLFCKKKNTRTYREKDILFVYTESPEHDIRTCIAVPYSEKAENDIDFFKALTAYFTIVHVFHNRACAKV